jgi:5-formyltetrahydrofolate cyclo-ligase
LLPSAAARIAGAFEVQIVDRVPAAGHDLAVDAIVTEARTLSPAR